MWILELFTRSYSSWTPVWASVQSCSLPSHTLLSVSTKPPRNNPGEATLSQNPAFVQYDYYPLTHHLLSHYYMTTHIVM